MARSRYRSMGIVAAMEAEEAEAVEAELEQETPSEEEVEIEEELEEIEEGTEEQAEDVEAVEEASDVEERLEKIEEVVEKYVENGEGLDPATAEVAEIAVEHFGTILGTFQKSKAMPSLESFSDKSKRLEASKIVLESIKEQLVKAGKAFWKFIKNLITRMVDWWDRVTNLNNRILSRAEKLKKVAGSTKEGKPAKDKLKLSGAAVAVMNGPKNVGDITKAVGTAKELSVKAYSAAEAAEGSIDKSGVSVGDFISKFREISEGSDAEFVFGGKNNPSAVKITVDGDNVSVSREGSSVDGEAVEISAPSISEVNNLLDAIIASAKTVADKSTLDKKFNGLIKELDNQAKKLSKDGGDKEESKRQRKAVRAFAILVNTFVNVSGALVSRTNGAAISFANSAMKNLKTK